MYNNSQPDIIIGTCFIHGSLVRKNDIRPTCTACLCIKKVPAEIIYYMLVQSLTIGNYMNVITYYIVLIIYLVADL